MNPKYPVKNTAPKNNRTKKALTKKPKRITHAILSKVPENIFFIKKNNKYNRSQLKYLLGKQIP